VHRPTNKHPAAQRKHRGRYNRYSATACHKGKGPWRNQRPHPRQRKISNRYRKHLAILILCFIVGLAAYFRFDRISAAPPGLSPDEAMEGNNAVEALETHYAEALCFD
jgi:hypothetical protein